MPDNLKTLTVTTINNSECDRLGVLPPNNVICTVSPPGQGLCYVDEGSPLVVGNFLVGIAVAMEMPYCAVGVPDAFTRLNHHWAWINGVILGGA